MCCISKSTMTHRQTIGLKNWTSADLILQMNTSALQWRWQSSSADVFQYLLNSCLSRFMFVDPHLTSHHSIYILGVWLRKVSAEHPHAFNIVLNVSLTMDLFSYHCGVLFVMVSRSQCWLKHESVLSGCLNPINWRFQKTFNGALVKIMNRSFADCYHRHLKSLNEVASHLCEFLVQWNRHDISSSRLTQFANHVSVELITIIQVIMLFYQHL